MLYADSSALVRAYFSDEPGSADLYDLLLRRGNVVATNELTRLELAGAVRAAERAGRLSASARLLEFIEKDYAPAGPIALTRFELDPLLAMARDLVLAFRLRTPDAIHLATASLIRLRSEPITFVTRDRDQADAAIALGFAVR